MIKTFVFEKYEDADKACNDFEEVTRKAGGKVFASHTDAIVITKDSKPLIMHKVVAFYRDAAQEAEEQASRRSYGKSWPKKQLPGKEFGSAWPDKFKEGVLSVKRTDGSYVKLEEAKIVTDASGKKTYTCSDGMVLILVDNPTHTTNPAAPIYRVYEEVKQSGTTTSTL